MLLVLLAAGYSGRLGIPKHKIKLANGHYLFEEIICQLENRGLLHDIMITTNLRQVEWWTKWRDRQIEPARYIIWPEPHKSPNAIHGCLDTVTRVVPYFSYGVLAKDVLISAIDSYFSDYSFLDKLVNTENAILGAKYPKEYAFQMGNIQTNWTISNPVLEYFIEKPDSEYAPTGLVFAAILKTTQSILKAVGYHAEPNFGRLVNLIKEIRPINVIKWDGTYWDVGTKPIYNMLLKEKMIKGKPL